MNNSVLALFIGGPMDRQLMWLEGDPSVYRAQERQELEPHVPNTEHHASRPTYRVITYSRELLRDENHLYHLMVCEDLDRPFMQYMLNDYQIGGKVCARCGAPRQ